MGVPLHPRSPTDSQRQCKNETMLSSFVFLSGCVLYAAVVYKKIKRLAGSINPRRKHKDDSRFYDGRPEGT